MMNKELNRAEIISQNVGLVHSCANKFRGRGIEYDDLFQAGCIGLIKAVDAFDEGRGVKLSTYAVPVILGEIKRLFRDGGTVKVSRSLKELAMKVAHARENFSHKTGREPTINEIADILGLDVTDIVEAVTASQPIISLTESDDEGGGQFDIPTGAFEEDLSDKLSLKTAIGILPSLDRKIIILRYFKGKTQTQTAEILNMTQVQISRR
ncbi:MAG: sigma-70 family RNA polymerase sigma factor, partial [Oscillospiraceae bacterium]|nr:sigma-70 family RNA polymerase sigma factor [Oscillospiraceae bacterium]